MSESDVLKLELASDPDVLPGVRQTVRRWALPRGWTDDQAAEIAMAVDEAISNVIRHSYACETTNRICLTACAIRDARGGEGVEIRVRDFGAQVDPAQICGRDLSDVRPGGLGVHIICAMMNTAEYMLAEGGGMLLVMRKYKGHSVSGKKAPGQAT